MKKGITAVLITSLILVMSMLNYSHASAESISDVQDKINQLEKEQKKIKGEQGNIHSDKVETENKMSQNKAKQSTIESEIQVLNKKLNATKTLIEAKETEIKETDEAIEALKNTIDKLKVEIISLEDRILKRELLLKERLVSMQKSGGNVGFIEVVFGAKNFSDFISRSSAVTTIMDQDKLIMDAQTADKLALEVKKRDVEEKKIVIEDKKLNLENQKNEMLALKVQLDDQAKQKKTLMVQLQSEHEELEEYNIGLEEEQKVLAAQAVALEKAKKMAVNDKKKLEQLAREKENAAGGNNLTGNKNGIFSWPANGRVSSHYGWRTHPIFGTKKLHAGTDIAVPTGTPLKAAASGVVSLASPLGGYGNAIMITHVINGQTYTTVYGHLSSMSVSPGQAVSEGQVIGATGNTGNSTGPHLHFEVHLGTWGNAKNNSVNPMNYLK